MPRARRKEIKKKRFTETLLETRQLRKQFQADDDFCLSVTQNYH